MTEEINWSAPTPPSKSPGDYGGFWIRLLAHICDQISSFVIVLPLAILLAVFKVDDKIGIAISAVASAWLIAYWTSQRGGSPLRVQLGVLVVNHSDGSFLTMNNALRRTMFAAILTIAANLYWIFILVALLDYVNFFWDPKKQTWHDKAAGSVVVKR